MANAIAFPARVFSEIAAEFTRALATFLSSYRSRYHPEF